MKKFPRLLLSKFSHLIEEVKLAYCVLFFLIVVLVVSSFYYYFTPFHHGIGNNGQPLQNITFWDSLYFSIVTISSLGYGDMHPMGISKFIAGIEVLVGLVLMGIMLAKITSKRLSYHVTRLYRSEIQKRLEEYIDEFLMLQKQLKGQIKLIGEKYQTTPGKTLLSNDFISVDEFDNVIREFSSKQIHASKYMSYETEHGDFFKTAPKEQLSKAIEVIDQSIFIFSQMIISMPTELRTSFLNTQNRKRVLLANEKLKDLCDLAKLNSKDDLIIGDFNQLMETCNGVPMDYYATPVVKGVEAPDQKLEFSDEPLEEKKNAT